MKATILVIIFLIKVDAFSQIDNCEDIGYPSKDTLSLKNFRFKLVHFYNTQYPYKIKFEIVNNNIFLQQDSFNKNRLIFISNTNKDTIFNFPCIPLTNTYIDTINKLLIGISGFKSWNVLVFDFNGRVLLSKKFSPIEAKLTKIQYNKFKKKFPSTNNKFRELNSINFNSNYYFIDFLGIRNSDSSAWCFLSKYAVQNHLCPLLKVSTGYYLDCCLNRSNPFKKIEVDKQGNKFLILNNYTGGTIKLKIDNGTSKF
ncbi:MAG: hypothetical protein Q8K70_10025 [Bacteroidota bacterium]|nr:hypothetical protein [Bacteroidota bacterium]